MKPTPSTLRRLWWLDPAWPFAGLIGCTMLAAWLQSPAAYALYRTPKYVETWHLVLTGGIILAFILGTRLAGATGRIPQTVPDDAEPIVRRWFYLTLGLTAFGYAAWLAVGIRNGFSFGLVWRMLTLNTPDADSLRQELFPTIAGVTTCTQFAIPALLLGMWLYFRGDRRVMPPLAVMVLVSALRTHLFNERTALIELLVPGTLLYLRMRVLGRGWPRWVQTGLRSAPFVAPLVLMLFFGGFEYFRSWQFYKQSFDSFPEFTAWRLSGYYTTAHNNGSMALETQPPRPLPYYTLRQVWLFPILRDSPVSYQVLTGIEAEEAHIAMLKRWGNDELNNEGGLFQPTLDFGVAGSLLFWVGYGFVAGRIFRGYQVGTLAGLTLYPLIYLSILEVPLILFISYPRMLPALVTLAVVSWSTRRGRAGAAAPASQRLEWVESV